MADDIRARLGLCCYTCHEFVASETKIDTCVYCGLSEWIHYYRRDVDALLTANAALEKALRRIATMECHSEGGLPVTPSELREIARDALAGDETGAEK